MLSFKILDNRNLEISVVDKEAFDEMIEEAIQKELADKTYMNIKSEGEFDHVPDPLQRDALMYDVFEDLFANSELRWMDAAQISAMTDSPLIGNYDPYPDPDCDEEPDPANPDRLWYYDPYCFKSPVVDLWRNGEVIFSAA
jgi:hypothetical protein